MSVKSITSLFPLIDDPANQFYGKLKSIYFSFMEAKADIKRKNRCKFLVTVNYPNISIPLQKIVDIRSFNNDPVIINLPDGEKPYFYLKVKIAKKDIANEEVTTVGEHIPVNEYSYEVQTDFVTDVSVFSFVEGEQKKVLIEEDLSYIYVYVGELFKVTSGYTLDLKMKPEEETYASIYKPEIGRKWEIHSDGSWILYSIDSNFEEILLDSTDVGFDTNLPSGQMSPYKDHPVDLCFDNVKDGDDTWYLYVYEKEQYENYVSRKVFANVKVFYRAEEVLYSNHSFMEDNLKRLFSSILFRNKEQGVNYRFREFMFLALSYLTGLNIRFFMYKFPDHTPIYTTSFIPYYNSPSRLFRGAFTSTNTYLQNSMLNAFPSISTRPYQFYIESNITVYLPITQNSLGLVRESPWLKAYFYNTEFLNNVKYGMNSFSSDSLSYRGSSTLENIIERAPFLFSNIGGKFSESWFYSGV